MMFMMPMPPTTSDTLAMPRRRLPMSYEVGVAARRDVERWRSRASIGSCVS